MADGAMEETQYHKLVKLVEDVEAATTKPEISFADMSETFAPQNTQPSHTYKELAVQVEELEQGRKPAPKEAEKPPEHQPHLVTTGLAQAKFAQMPPVAAPPQLPPKKGLFRPKVPKVEAQLPSPPQPQPVQVTTAQEKKESMSKELSQIAGRLGPATTPFGNLTRKKINIKDLVLPNLSIADQISELERIIEGLKQHVFDEDHMGIVAEEVYGLKQFVADSKRGKAAAPTESLEQSLVVIRDQRLAEATTLIETYGAE